VSTTQINDDLIRITRWRSVNAFLVREDDGFTLVDTTLPEMDEAILRAGGPRFG
jgi:hypothetical protein